MHVSGFYDGNTVRDMLKECSKMAKFDHPNVLTLRGVCLDGGPAPYIIMPFMANGNLLTYLKDNRKTLIVTRRSEDDEVSSVIIMIPFLHCGLYRILVGNFRRYPVFIVENLDL